MTTKKSKRLRKVVVKSDFKQPNFEFNWSDYKCTNGERFFRVGGVHVHVQPSGQQWRVVVDAASGPDVRTYYRNGSTVQMVDNTVPLHPLTSDRYSSRRAGQAAAERMFRQIMRFAGDMVDVSRPKVRVDGWPA